MILEQALLRLGNHRRAWIILQASGSVREGNLFIILWGKSRCLISRIIKAFSWIISAWHCDKIAKILIVERRRPCIAILFRARVCPGRC